MSDEFEADRPIEGLIRIRRRQEGHRYSFYISFDDQGRRQFVSGDIRVCETAKRNTAVFEIEAFRYAKREARRCGLLDYEALDA